MDGWMVMGGWLGTSDGLYGDDDDDDEDME